MAEGLVIEDGVLTDGRGCAGELAVPEGVAVIGDKAFYGNRALTGLALAEGVTSIGDFAVSGCENLAFVSVPQSVVSLGECALVKKFESDVGFTHTMENKEIYPEIRCKEGSWIDKKLQEIKKSDVKGAAHSIIHIIEIKYN
jgi:hypothetical protein